MIIRLQSSAFLLACTVMALPFPAPCQTAQGDGSPETPPILAKLKANQFRDDASLLRALADTNTSRLGSELRTELRRFAERNPGAKVAVTADLWLAATELRFTGGTSTVRKKERIAESRQTLERIARTNLGSWHSKAARFATVGCLMAAKDWTAFDEQANEILGSVARYTNSPEEELGLFFTSIGIKAAEVECEIRASLMIVASSQAHFAKALAHAQTLQSAFPAWSEQHGISNVIERLKRNESPYSLR